MPCGWYFICQNLFCKWLTSLKAMCQQKGYFSSSVLCYMIETIKVFRMPFVEVFAVCHTQLLTTREWFKVLILMCECGEPLGFLYEQFLCCLYFVATVTFWLVFMQVKTSLASTARPFYLLNPLETNPLKLQDIVYQIVKWRMAL